MTEKIKQYWEERANLLKDKNSTTDDIWLRELEIQHISKTLSKINLPENGNVLDIGCGDGFSTISIAKKFPDIFFHGMDFSQNMITMANSRLERSGIKNMDFQVGDVLELDQKFSKEFDAVITDRCLINLESLQLQKKAFSKIAKIIKNGGYYIGIENFMDGQNEMNKIRIGMDLPEIPIRWHNLFFSENDFIEITKENFKIVSVDNFSSSYYFATRIIYSKMCQMNGIDPDYNHEIHQLAINLPYFGNFSPIKCVVLQKKEE